jgi:hypothetical protein
MYPGSGPEPPPPTGTLHVGNLTGSSSKVNAKTWKATVIVTVHDEEGALVSDATVTGTWSTGGTSTAKTGSNGTCTVSSGNINNKIRSVTFTVSNISKTGYNYVPSPSDKTSVTVAKP